MRADGLLEGYKKLPPAKVSHSLWSLCSSHKCMAFVFWRSVHYCWSELHDLGKEGSQTVSTRAWLPYHP